MALPKFLKKPNPSKYSNSFKGRQQYKKDMKAWKNQARVARKEGQSDLVIPKGEIITGRRNPKTIGHEAQIKIGNKWVNKAKWYQQAKKALAYDKKPDQHRDIDQQDAINKVKKTLANQNQNDKKKNPQLKVNQEGGGKPGNSQGTSSKKFVNKVGGDAVNPKTPTTKSNTITHPNYKPRKPKPVYEHHRGTQAKIGTGASPLRNRGPIQTQRATFAPGERDYRGRPISEIKGLNPETGMIDRANFKALGLDIPRDSISVTPEYLGGRNFSNVKTLGQAYQLKGTSPMFTKGIVGNALDLHIMKLSQQQAQAQAAAAKLKEAVQPQGGDQTPNVDQTTNVNPTQGGGGGTQSQVTTNAVPLTNAGVPAFNYPNLVQQPWAQQAFNPASQGLAISGVGAAPLNIAKMPTFIPPPTMFTPPPVLPPMAFPTTGLSIMGAGAG